MATMYTFQDSPTHILPHFVSSTVASSPLVKKNLYIPKWLKMVFQDILKVVFVSNGILKVK